MNTLTHRLYNGGCGLHWCERRPRSLTFPFNLQVCENVLTRVWVCGTTTFPERPLRSAWCRLGPRPGPGSRDTHLTVHLWEQLQELLLGVCGEGGEGAHVDERTDVGVHQDGAGRLKVHVHPSSVPLHGPCVTGSKEGRKHGHPPGRRTEPSR